eukprot:CCRYP_008262-RB/>CCRYP_008262-RB protein AED:0.22 eAED:0.22 QI:0/0.66/0.5/1/0.33/0/4/1398/245
MHQSFIIYHLISFTCLISSVRSFTNPSHVVANKSATANRIFLASASKWDSLIDDDDDEVPRDMKYNMFNIDRQRKNFESIRSIAGKDLTNDVYARDPDSDTFWFIGKVARVSDVPLEKAIGRQWPLIEEHAARLRPAELYPKWGSIELWVAPGDSEVDVAYCRPEIQYVRMFRGSDEESSSVRNVEVGFQGELYENGEEGFRTVRTADGKPAKPEIMSGGENRQPSEAEMDELMEMLNSQIPPDD